MHSLSTHPFASAFAAAVDWSERWIQALLAFHALLWCVVLANRRNMGVQVRVMCEWYVGLWMDGIPHLLPFAHTYTLDPSHPSTPPSRT